jgi:hypothetical protein
MPITFTVALEPIPTAAVPLAVVPPGLRETVSWPKKLLLAGDAVAAAGAV